MSNDQRLPGIESLILEPILWNQPERVGLAERMVMHGVPGVSVAVIEDGQLSWARAYGVLAAGGTDAVTVETRFQAGSISKAITATAVMRLVQEGRLDLDEDVNAYLRSWKVPANGDWQPRITLRQLLSHSAGTTIHGFFGYAVGDVLPTTAQTLAGVPPANTRPVRVNLLPGTQFRYSGGGTVIVQLVLMDVTEQQFPQLMRELVFDPLGMHQSTFEQPSTSEDSTRATGHHVGDGIVHGHWRVYPEVAAAGLWTTPADLARWMGALLHTLRGENGTLLSQETVRQMVSPQIERHIGLGVFIHGSGDTLRFGHEGDTAGFQAEVFGYPATGAGFVVMSNSDMAYTLRKDIVRTLAVANAWEDLVPAERQPFEVSADVEAQHAGKFRLRGGLVRIDRRNGALWLEMPGQGMMRLAPMADGAYMCAAVNAEVIFRQGRDGAVQALVLRQEKQEIEAERL